LGIKIKEKIHDRKEKQNQIKWKHNGVRVYINSFKHIELWDKNPYKSLGPKQKWVMISSLNM
jgi:hypothetical protein